MPDVFTKRKRSEVMSRIRSRGNKETELALAKLLRAHGITEWRRQQAVRVRDQRPRFTVPGCPITSHQSRVTIRPDFIFLEQRVAVFVDGCFWHGCPWHSRPAKWIRKSAMAETARSFSRVRGIRMTDGRRRTGKSFWRQKLAANEMRDEFVTRTLRRAGWRVVRIWEHELRKPGGALGRVERALRRR